MAYRTNRDELIKLFDRTNTFLQNLENYPEDYVSNEDNLTTDGIPKKKKIKIEEFEEIVKNMINE